jgi:hypothetical protein
MIADPSAERRRHDRITRAVATVPDAHGGIGHPWLTETPLDTEEEAKRALSAMLEVSA